MADGFLLRRVDVDGAITYELTGALDRRSAEEVSRAIGEERAPFVLDVTHVRHFDDTAVPVLSGALRHHPGRMRGVGEHWRRLFRYFGVEA